MKLDIVTECGQIYDRLGEQGIDGEIRKMVCILHPRVENPIGFKGGDEDIAAEVAVLRRMFKAHPEAVRWRCEFDEHAVQLTEPLLCLQLRHPSEGP